MLSLFSSRLRQIVRSPQRRRRCRNYCAPAVLERLEDRALLAASLQLIPTTGIVIYGGSSVGNDLTISYDSGTGDYTFSDTAETITLDPDLLGIGGTGSGTGTVTFDAAAAAAASTGTGGVLTLIRVNGNDGDDIVTVDSFRAGAEGLDVRNNAGQGTDTVNIDGDIGSGVSPTLDEVKFNGETINLDANVWTDNHGVDITGPLNVISGSRIIDAGTEAVTFTEEVDGPGSLTIVASFVEFAGEVGGGTALDALTVTGDVLVMGAASVGAGDMVLTADVFVPNGDLSGTGELFIANRTPGADLSFDPDALGFITPGFSHVTLGSIDTGTLTIERDSDNNLLTGSLSVSAPLTLIGDEVLVKDSITKGGFELEIITNSLRLFRRGTAWDAGDVRIEKLTVGGTLMIDGTVGRHYGPNLWGFSDLTIDAPGSDVVMTKALGSNIDNLTVIADTFSHDFRAAINVGGDVTLDTSVLVGGGIFSRGGSVLITGGVDLTGNFLLKTVAGETVTVVGPISAAGNNIVVRGVGGALAAVGLGGGVFDAGTFGIDSGGTSTATMVDLGDVFADSIIIKGLDVTLHGFLSAGAGNIDIFGPVTLTGDTALFASGAVRVNGTIDGPFILDVMAGGIAKFGGEVGGAAPLAAMHVFSSGNNYVTKPITVMSDFEWCVPGGRLIVRADITVLDGGGVITLGALDLKITAGLFADSIFLMCFI